MGAVKTTLRICSESFCIQCVRENHNHKWGWVLASPPKCNLIIQSWLAESMCATKSVVVKKRRESSVERFKSVTRKENEWSWPSTSAWVSSCYVISFDDLLCFAYWLLLCWIDWYCDLGDECLCFPYIYSLWCFNAEALQLLLLLLSIALWWCPLLHVLRCITIWHPYAVYVNVCSVHAQSHIFYLF